MDPLPSSLRLTPTFQFVGRSDELGALRALMPTTPAEGRRIALVGGEPGSGKSRLSREFAVEAAEAGALVLYGACDAHVSTPYGPFVEALDYLARTVQPRELREALGPTGSELTRLLPDLELRVGDLPDRVEADPDTERHRLHTAITDLLTGASGLRPILLVLEDGHWADTPTLLLLRHLARAAGDARMLLLATFRDAEADVPETLSDALADLRRSDGVTRIHLSSLSDAEVAEFVRQAAGDDVGGAPQVARALTELTGGNPFLVCELWRTLVETRALDAADGAIRFTVPLAELGSPESVREVVSKRLNRLDPGAIDLLELAATAGTEFEFDLLRRAGRLDEPRLVRALEEAVRSAIIEELPDRGLVFQFTHELVRRALYDRLTGMRRAELHLRVGEALEGEQGPEGSLSRAPAELAHHFAAAAPFGGADRGVEYNLLAARAAVAVLDFDQAAERFGIALAIGIEDPSRRADVLLERGNASNRAGKAADALEAFRSAADLGRDLGDADLLARAAIGYEDTCWRPAIADEAAVELLDEAAAALGDESSELRVGLLGGLARALDYRGEHERGERARTSAIEMARRLGDRSGLATVLAHSYWSRGSTPLGEILEMLTEARDLAEELGDTELRAEAMAWRVPAFVALCDLASARNEMSALLKIAEQTAQPFMLHVALHYGSALALGDGRLADAEAMSARSHEWSRLLTGRDPSGVHGIQMFSIRREQGRLVELAPLIRILAGEDKREGPWRPGLVSLLVELDMEDEARRELARIASDGLDAYRHSLWLASLTYLADACTALGDETMAALVYPELEPLAGGNVMIGHLVAFYGAADRHLGMLASTLGEWDRAALHFERALELNRQQGSKTWLAHTAYQYARLLRRRPRGDYERASALLGQAGELAASIGMGRLSAGVQALGTGEPRAELPDDLSPREAQVIALVAHGLSNRKIGGRLNISEHTAANHLRSILRKTGCSNRTEAAHYAHQHGLVKA